MASVSGTSSSSTSSIYGNRNIFSGLASGLDTESMIENSVAGYKAKIESLQKQQTKLTWKQDAYRGITDKLIDLSRKYTSYTSKTNLSSLAFFNNAVTTESSGKYADLISASGKGSSNVTINGVSQLATAARYQVNLGSGSGSQIQSKNLTGEAIDWSTPMETSRMSGSMTLTYGNKLIDLNFGSLDVYKNPEELKKAIEDKLSEQTITISGTSYKASDRIKVDLNGDKISFSDASTAGNSVYISYVSGDLEDTLGIKTGREDGTSFNVPGESSLVKNTSMAEYMSNKKLAVKFNGVSKNIDTGDLKNTTIKVDGNDVKIGDLSKEQLQANRDKITEALAGNIQKSLDVAFGENAVTVKGKDGGLSFDTAPKYKNSTLSVSSDYNDRLGLGNGLTSYANTNSTLEQLLGTNWTDGLEASKSADFKNGAWSADSKVKWYDEDGKEMGSGAGSAYGIDSNGNRVDHDTGNLIDDEGNPLYSLEINGVSVGNFGKKSTLGDVLKAINNNAEAGVNVEYSQMSNSLVFNAKQAGEAGRINISGGLAEKLFGEVNENTENYTSGSDAVVNVTVNGVNMDLVRNTNEIDIDGLKINLKGTFNEGYQVNDKGQITDKDGNLVPSVEDPVKLTTKANADTIVDGIKSFVEDLNALLKETHDAYATQPEKKSGSRYETYDPLSDAEKDDLTDKQIERYEEKAKKGVLFGDSTLSSLYSRLRSAITPGGELGGKLRSIGINSVYEDGVTTLSIDEEKLRSALDTDPDKVRDVFAGTTESGTTNGIMSTLKKTMDTYASTSIASPGILVRRAGTTKSTLSLNDNSVQDQIDNIEKQIEKWQDKMSDKIDYYTRQFTALEQLMATMNNQSSMLSGLAGGY